MSRSGHEDTVVQSGETIEAERFVFVGDLKGSVWFGRDGTCIDIAIPLALPDD